jgi:hypothetical protein
VSASRYCCLLLPVLGLVVAAMPADESASSSPAADLEHNRRLLQQWKADPEHYSRLQADLHAFWASTREDRQRLRKLDRDLHQLDAGTQKRLWKAAERYALWVERLPEEDRRSIERAGDSSARLRQIREIRQRQMIERLPQKIGEELQKLPAEQRAARLVQLREQERQQRKIWQRPVGVGGQRPAKPPANLRELPPESQHFFEKYVLPRLSDEERARLRQVEGRPEFGEVVKHLAELHPYLPPRPAPHKPIVRYEDLPDAAKVQAGPKPVWERRVQIWERLRKVEGKWPEWALAFHAELTPEQRKHMHPLGASRPGEFSPEVQAFLAQTLKPAIPHKEWLNLRDVEGKWPEYPKRLLDLAHRHKLEVPGMSLPGWNEP